MAPSLSSVLLGLGLGGGYGMAAYVMGRFALGQPRSRFLALAMGGMLIRMATMLAALGLTLAFVPVRPLPFAGALVISLLAGLAAEMFVLHRHATNA